ncbi:MAG: glycosyltransferase family 4 protein [Rhizobacter sp.]
MRILTVSNCPLKESQGSGYVIMGYAEGLRRLGHDVECVGPEAYELMPSVRHAKRWRFALGMALFGVRRRFFSSFDLVEFYGAESWLLVLLLRCVGTRCVLVHHSNGLETLQQLELTRNSGTDTHSGAPRRWYQFRASSLLAQAFKQVDALVLVSRHQHRHAVEMKYQPGDRLLSIETPLPEVFLDQRVDGPRPTTLGYCGAWLRTKGTDMLTDAVNHLLQVHPGVTLQLVGVGSEFDKFTVFDPQICGRIHVSPFIATKPELMQWYRSISILLMPSYSDSFGLVTAEAMACGCAVVATRTGFAADLHDRQEVMLQAGFTAQHVVAAVTPLLESDALRRHVSMGGYQRVQALRWDAAAQALEAFYVRCFAAKRRH